MALPPLELFSLARRPPCCRVAFSFLCRLQISHSMESLQHLREAARIPMWHYADVAQLVEQLIRNQQVNGSSPFVGSSISQRKHEGPVLEEGPFHFRVRATRSRYRARRRRPRPTTPSKPVPSRASVEGSGTDDGVTSKLLILNAVTSPGSFGSATSTSYPLLS